MHHDKDVEGCAAQRSCNLKSQMQVLSVILKGVKALT